MTLPGGRVATGESQLLSLPRRGGRGGGRVPSALIKAPVRTLDVQLCVLHNHVVPDLTTKCNAMECETLLNVILMSHAIILEQYLFLSTQTECENRWRALNKTGARFYILSPVADSGHSLNIGSGNLDSAHRRICSRIIIL